MKRVFINNDGMWYKAEAPKAPSHAERTLVTADLIEALPENGSAMHLIDAEVKMQTMIAQRNSPVQVAPEQKVEETQNVSDSDTGE